MSVVHDLNILSVLKPLHFFLQIFGLTSFSIRSDPTHGYKCNVSVYNVFILVLSTCWHLYGIYYVSSVDSVWEIEGNGNESEIVNNGVSAVLVLNCAITTFSIWWFFTMKSKFVPILKDIDEVDNVLTSLHSPTEHAKHRQILCIALILQNIIITSLTGGSFLSAYCTDFYKPNIFTSISEFVAFQYIYLLLVYFNFFTLSVRRRYQRINSLLENAAALDIVDVEVYQKLATLHDKMVDVTENLNFCFGTPVSFEKCNGLFDFQNNFRSCYRSVTASGL